MTPTGTPAAANCSTTRSRAPGDAVRGSSVRLMSWLKDVMLSITDTSRSRARSTSSSRSLKIKALLVMSETGCRQRASTRSMPRVTSSRFSSGW